MGNNQLTERLPRDTWVTHVECHAELASTNDHSLALIAEGAGRFPSIVLAEQQTAGRGRGQNRWWSGPGALTFSLIVDSKSAGFELGSDPRTALLAGLTVAETVGEFLPVDNAGVKWPNDVYVGGRKISGILVEIPPSRRDLAVIGVGINVNNSTKEAPAELRKTVTALCDQTGRRCSRDDVLVRFAHVAKAVFANFSRDPAGLPTKWRERCVLMGKTVTAELVGERIVGRCDGIGEDGSLLVETEEGPRAIRSAKTVRAVHP